ncbi:hypothetical protein KCP70_00490 [Salmonella enterica subsp. enterica]|nr:hypothetical protein KCP70_00490 [Salmonella enterica subsp. enterica]
MLSHGRRRSRSLAASQLDEKAAAILEILPHDKSSSSMGSDNFAPRFMRYRRPVHTSTVPGFSRGIAYVTKINTFVAAFLNRA